MERAARAASSSAAKMSGKETCLSSGKENVRPSERGRAVLKKISFTECEMPRQTRVSLEKTDLGVSSDRSRAILAKTLTAKKTPFHVHCDDRNFDTLGPRASRQGFVSYFAEPGGEYLRARKDDGAQAECRRVDGVSCTESRKQSTRQSGSHRCPCNEPQSSRNAQPSSIPLRFRATSTPAVQEKCPAQDASRRSVSTETGARVQTQLRSVGASNIPSSRRATSMTTTTTTTRPVGNGAPSLSRAVDSAGAKFHRGRLAETGNVLRERSATRAGNSVATSRARNVSTPIDYMQPPPVPMSPKAAIRLNKSKVGQTNEARHPEPPSGPNDRDPLPPDLLYHAVYNEDLPLVERDREDRSPRLSTSFLLKHINADQRRLVVTFLIHIGMHCRYPSYIIYQSVKLFDLAMDRIPVGTTFIQLTALTSLWIALKKQENFHRIPSATTMVSLAQELYVGREDLLIAYEKRILQSLNFNVTFADVFSLFSHHLINCRRRIDLPSDTTTFLYACGSYVIDVTLLDERFCRASVSLIAVSIVELVLGLNLDTKAAAPVNPRWLFWRGLLFASVPQLSGRFQDQEIDRVRVAMLRSVLTSGRKHSCFEIVYKKYSRSRYGCISELFLERVKKVCYTETCYDP